MMVLHLNICIQIKKINVHFCPSLATMTQTASIQIIVLFADARKDLKEMEQTVQVGNLVNLKPLAGLQLDCEHQPQDK